MPAPRSDPSQLTLQPGPDDDTTTPTTRSARPPVTPSPAQHHRHRRMGRASRHPPPAVPAHGAGPPADDPPGPPRCGSIPGRGHRMGGRLAGGNQPVPAHRAFPVGCAVADRAPISLEALVAEGWKTPCKDLDADVALILADVFAEASEALVQVGWDAVTAERIVTALADLEPPRDPRSVAVEWRSLATALHRPPWHARRARLRRRPSRPRV